MGYNHLIHLFIPCVISSKLIDAINELFIMVIIELLILDGFKNYFKYFQLRTMNFCFLYCSMGLNDCLNYLGVNFSFLFNSFKIFLNQFDLNSKVFKVLMNE